MQVGISSSSKFGSLIQDALLVYCDSQIYCSTAVDWIKEVSDGIKGLFDAYSICSTRVD